MAADRWESVVFIDLDHTLLEGPFDAVVFPQVLGKIAQQSGLDYDTLLRLVRKENLERQHNPAFSAVQAMDWDDILTQAAYRLGVKLKTNALEVVQVHPGPPYTLLHAGAREALEQLAAARPGRALVLATKGLRKYQLPILEAHGLLPFFDDILTPDANQALKQSIAFYARWPQMTCVQIMVGDTYEDDILPARRFGFKTVWKPRVNPEASPAAVVMDPFLRVYEKQYFLTDQVVRPDAIILSLSELPEVVERLEYDYRAA